VNRSAIYDPFDNDENSIENRDSEDQYRKSDRHCGCDFEQPDYRKRSQSEADELASTSAHENLSRVKVEAQESNARPT